MQKIAIFIAYFFICVNLKCFSQQYPFVHYSPKDGLISNQIRNIYQDSKGRLYFTSVNGLSIYDGSRFTNYTSKNGLNFDIVNCIMEMGDDSVWIVTNSSVINCLVSGKLKTVNLKQAIIPIINMLFRDDKRTLYAATDQGLFFLDKDHFVKLPFIDKAGKDINTFVVNILPIGDYLLIQRDVTMTLDQQKPLYLYNKITKKITSEVSGIYAVNKAVDGRVWVSTNKNIMSVDTAELKKGKIILQDLPETFSRLKNLGKFFILFDRSGNGWIGDQSKILIKATPNGNITTLTPSSGLSMFYVDMIFQDREGITWFATNNAGVNKLVHSNFSFTETPFKTTLLTDISYDKNNNELWLYSNKNANVTIIGSNSQQSYQVKNANEVKQIINTPFGIFGTWGNNIYKMIPKGNTLSPKKILSDLSDNTYNGYVIDKNGNLIVAGRYNLSAIVNGKYICKRKLNFFSDHVAIDSKGNIWMTNRDDELIMYHPNPGDPTNYLEEKKVYQKKLFDISPRSITIDKNDNVWIGTRNHGIYVFSIKEETLVKQFLLTTDSGLSDNFTTHLTCDLDNNIWACSALGLDKISIKNGVPVIENITKQNNIYQSVFKVVIDKDNTAWGLVSNGLIKITAENIRHTNYSPTLMVNMIKTGKDTIFNSEKTHLSYKQNNLSFYFAATSFLNEKQILYSYRLQKGSSNQWSEPSNNTSISFIDLSPGDYILDIKAIFPAGSYPEKIISYKFSIAPPWWQTWWFRIVSALLIIGVLISGSRFYFRRKLEKQMAILEKQQAIEKERTRIATDMHDDLGAGLSRIKFLSETIGIKKQQQQSFEEDISKIREYSHEMIDKMGEIVWALNEKNDSLSDLLSYTRSYAVEYLSQNGIKCNIETPEKFPIGFVSGEFRRNIYLTVKEALHNVVKHAQASEVNIQININHSLDIEIKDNGTGFDKLTIRAFSNGLSNMQSRIKEIGGMFEILNGNGTLIRIKVPLNG